MALGTTTDSTERRVRVPFAVVRGGFSVVRATMETLPKLAPTTTLADVVERVVQRARMEMMQLCESAPGRADFERRAELARYAHRTRQRLTRALIAEKFAVKSAKIVNVATNAHLVLRGHEEAFARAADGLFHLHQQLEWAKAPLWDLPGALDVLCNGTYGGLPREISEIGARAPEASAEEGEAPAESEEEREARLDVEARYEEEMTERLVRSKTYGCEARDDHAEWPSEKFKVFSIAGGKTTVGVEGEYRATLTLGGPVAPNAEEQPRYGGWRVESIELLAGDLDGKFELNKAEARKLADIACASMVGMLPFGQKPAEDAPPLEPRHIKGLHSTASDAVLMKCATAILTQAGVLKDVAERAASVSKRWSRNSLKVEIVKGEGAGILKGLRVAYWRDASEGNPGVLDVSFNPEESDLRVKTQSPGEDEFNDLPINHERVDLEAILLEGIRIASSKKLHAIAKELSGEKMFKTIVEESMTAEECACREDEDGWADEPRPALRLVISKFTNIFVSCCVSDGTLILHGADELVPPATEAELSKRLALEGYEAIGGIVEEVSVAVEQQELKGLLRTSGTSVHPAPRSLGGDPWTSSPLVPNGAAPTALVPVVPTDGGVFVATWMEATPTFALVRAHRASPASRFTVDSIEKLNLGARKGSKADVVAKLIGEACQDLATDAQRAALTRALRDLKIPFMDIRPTAKGADEKKIEHTISFEISDAARWAQSTFKRAVTKKSSLKAHVALRGAGGLSARVADETRAYKHSEFAVNVLLGDVRRIAAAQGFLSALEDNDSGVDFKKIGCALRRVDAYSVAATYENDVACSVEWRHSGYLGAGLYADGENLSAPTKRALSVAARDGRAAIFACALRAAAAAARLAANLPAEFQLAHSEPNVIAVVKMIEPNPVRAFSLGFRLDGSFSIIVGRGGDAASGAQDAEDDEAHISDEHESLLPERSESLTQLIDTVSSAVEGITGTKPSHGETVVVAASSLVETTDALVAAVR